MPLILHVLYNPQTFFVESFAIFLLGNVFNRDYHIVQNTCKKNSQVNFPRIFSNKFDRDIFLNVFAIT